MAHATRFVDPQFGWTIRVPKGLQVGHFHSTGMGGKRRRPGHELPTEPRGSEHQHAAWAVVRSLRFPALREGAIWQGTYYVLGRASRYPAGSVTTFPAASLPSSRSLSVHIPEGFYLIHAPRAFYVIERLFEKSARPFTKCRVAFDPKAFQFFCPGTDLRWNRVGQPVGAHAGGGPDWALPLHVATVAQEGHVLFSPFWGGLLPVDLKGNPWR